MRSLAFENLFRNDEYGVAARHGHEWDEQCHALSFYNKVLKPGKAPDAGRFDPAVYRVMAIGEVVTAELMSGLVHYARTAQPSSTPDWTRFMDWDRLERDLLVTGDLTDRLAFLRKNILGDSFEEFSSRVESAGELLAIVDKVKGDRDDYARGAEQEWEAGGCASDRTQYVLYGHTHKARHLTFHASRDGRVRMYINTGTLLPLIQRTTSREGFGTDLRMTIAFFYRADEDQTGRADQGPTLDLWDGIRRKTYTYA